MLGKQSTDEEGFWEHSGHVQVTAADRLPLRREVGRRGQRGTSEPKVLLNFNSAWILSLLSMPSWALAFEILLSAVGAQVKFIIPIPRHCLVFLEGWGQKTETTTSPTDVKSKSLELLPSRINLRSQKTSTAACGMATGHPRGPCETDSPANRL